MFRSCEMHVLDCSESHSVHFLKDKAAYYKDLCSTVFPIVLMLISLSLGISFIVYTLFEAETTLFSQFQLLLRAKFSDVSGSESEQNSNSGSHSDSGTLCFCYVYVIVFVNV